MKNVIFEVSKEGEDIGTIEVTEQGLRVRGDQQRLETVTSPLYAFSGIKNLRMENGKVIQGGVLAIKPENFDGICGAVRCYLKEVLQGVVEVKELT